MTTVHKRRLPEAEHEPPDELNAGGHCGAQPREADLTWVSQRGPDRWRLQPPVPRPEATLQATKARKEVNETAGQFANVQTYIYGLNLSQTGRVERFRPLNVIAVIHISKIRSYSVCMRNI